MGDFRSATVVGVGGLGAALWHPLSVDVAFFFFGRTVVVDVPPHVVTFTLRVGNGPLLCQPWSVSTRSVAVAL